MSIKTSLNTSYLPLIDVNDASTTSLSLDESESLSQLMTASRSRCQARMKPDNGSEKTIST
jgi:hypothetical protein